VLPGRSTRYPPSIGEKVLGLLLRDLLGRQAARLPQEAPLRGVARPESRLEDAQLARDSARIDLSHFSDWQRRWISRVGYRLPVQLPTTPSPSFFFPQHNRVGHTTTRPSREGLRSHPEGERPGGDLKEGRARCGRQHGLRHCVEELG
jgi:hypothetical protein